MRAEVLNPRSAEEFITTVALVILILVLLAFDESPPEEMLTDEPNSIFPRSSIRVRFGAVLFVPAKSIHDDEFRIVVCENTVLFAESWIAKPWRETMVSKVNVLLSLVASTSCTPVELVVPLTKTVFDKKFPSRMPLFKNNPILVAAPVTVNEFDAT